MDLDSVVNSLDFWKSGAWWTGKQTTYGPGVFLSAAERRNPAPIFENLTQNDDDELNAPGFGMWFRVSVDSLSGWWDPEYQGKYLEVQRAYLRG